MSVLGGRRLRLLLLTVVFATVSPVVVAATPVCAAEGARAGLVVDTGASVQTFCVALPDGQTSGLELIALANQQHGLAYKLGFGGEAVCMLAGVGPTSDDCFEEYPNFWGYWRGDGRGGWIWSGSGAGSATVTDGDVEGWSWGSGSDGNSHPRPPDTSFGDVCAAAAEEPAPAMKPRPRKDDRRSSGSGTGKGGSEGRPAPGPTAATAGERPAPKAGPKRLKDSTGDPRKERRGKARPASDKEAPVAPAPSFSPPALDEQATRALEPAPPPGPPAAGLVALGAAGVLGGAGFVLARRRRST